MVAFSPNAMKKSPTMMGLTNGEEKRNAKVGPNPACALSRPTMIGIVEQLQNGVKAPRPAPIK
uniref:Uncharacterized protein n=1 Tax=uncultured microorganism TaxID=358574 RepID=I2FJN0_9ZZZZ|nr:hypothetical protein [uncultured microorganism]